VISSIHSYERIVFVDNYLIRLEYFCLHLFIFFGKFKLMSSCKHIQSLRRKGFSVNRWDGTWIVPSVRRILRRSRNLLSGFVMLSGFLTMCVAINLNFVLTTGVRKGGVGVEPPMSLILYKKLYYLRKGV